MNTNETYADRVIRDAMAAVAGGLDPQHVEDAIGEAIKAIGKQMAALAAKDYGAMPAAEIARAVAHTTKASDVLYRLAEFASGRPDSRPDVGSDWLRALTDEQLRIVQSWVEGKVPERAPRPRREDEPRA